MQYRFLFALFAVAAVSIASRADTVFVKGREKGVVGTVKLEDAKGVKIVVKGTEEILPGADVIDVHYDDVKPSDLRLAGGAYLVAKRAEADADSSADGAKRKASLATAIAKYKETLTKMQAHKYAHRNLDYKIAVLTLRQAQASQGSTKEALIRLEAFKSKYPNSWQINHVVPTLAQLQMDEKDFKGAIATYQEMSEMEVFPADIRRNAELMVVEVTVKSGDLKGAQKKLDALEKKAGGNVPFLSRIKMARAEVLVGEKKVDQAVPILRQLLKENKDVRIKAQAHNTLGECLFRANRYSEAVWEFLYVDAVYNQDKNERAKALYYLWKTFGFLNNEERSRECLQTLLNDAQFQGTEFQQCAMKESK